MQWLLLQLTITLLLLCSYSIITIIIVYIIIIYIIMRIVIVIKKYNFTVYFLEFELFELVAEPVLVMALELSIVI